MSSDQPYTPTDDEVHESFVIGQTRDGYGADWDDLIPEAREEFARWLAAHDARVRRDAFEKGIATGYMRGYHDSEVGLLYSPPIPPTAPEEKR